MTSFSSPSAFVEETSEILLRFFHESTRMLREARREARLIAPELLSADDDLELDERDVPYETWKIIERHRKTCRF